MSNGESATLDHLGDIRIRIRMQGSAINVENYTRVDACWTRWN
ncbi:MAG: hypothetical protein ACTSWN_16670 [Promethearchaeota archaeon]